MKLTPHEVFTRLMEIMCEDNGFAFDYTEQHEEDALPAIVALQVAGYFEDSPYDLDGSFWMAGAGEHTEAQEFFDKAPVAFDDLSVVLDKVFNAEV